MKGFRVLGEPLLSRGLTSRLRVGARTTAGGVSDTTAPAVLNVTATTANGQYAAGATIAVTVQFTEAVTVTGNPRIQLETGSTDRYATYLGGSGTDTLTFNYTVVEGDYAPDLDYKATDSLDLNGGSIKDAAGNDATLTLVAPGQAGSLGANKAIVIFTPTGIAGLIAWYDPSDVTTLYQTNDTSTPVTADGQSVGYVADKSGQGNHLLQATAGARLIYKTNVQNGKSALVQPVGGGKFIQSSTFTGGEIAQPNTIFTAVKTASGSVDGNIFGGIPSGKNHQIYVTSSVVTLYAGAGPASTGYTLPASSAVLLTTLFSGASSTLRVNGAQQGGAVNAGSENLTGVTLFADSGGNGKWPANNAILEHLVYDSISDTNRGFVETYLNNGWVFF